MQKRTQLLYLFALLLTVPCLAQSNKQKYDPTWPSLAQYQIPEWFKDQKFGIFIHWGPNSVPDEANTDWYSREMYQRSVREHHNGDSVKIGGHPSYEFHKKTYGDQTTVGFKDLIPLFTAEKFNAESWAELFKKSGAKYVVPVAEHHDGFAMYNSSLTRWNATRMGPKRDLLAELKEAIQDQGLTFGLSSHYAFNWNYYPHLDDFDTNDPAFADLYSSHRGSYSPADANFLNMWWARTKELIDNYQPDILWFDFCSDRPEFEPYHPIMASHFYNSGVARGKEVVLQTKNFRNSIYPDGVNVRDLERNKFDEAKTFFWQTDTSIGKNSWFYTQQWISKSANTLIDDLVDIVSKNGCLLLNIGPRKDGTIPEDQQAILLQMGEWLRLNGEAVYSSRPFKIYGEGPTKIAQGHLSEDKNKDLGAEDIRFTVNKGQLYAILMDWPASGKAVIRSLAQDNALLDGKVASIKLIGYDKKIPYRQTKNGLELTLPRKPVGNYAYVFKVN